MFRTSQWFVAAVISIACAAPASAGDIFGIFKCGTSCDECCDVGCSELGCGELGCGETSCCDSGCDGSGCSLDSPLKNLFSGFGGCGKDGCDSGCCDSDYGSGCDSGCAPQPCNYVSLMGGWSLLDDYSGENETVLPTPPTLRGTFNDGWGFAIAHGRCLGNSFRGEVEFAFRSNTADQWFVNAVQGIGSGHVFAYSGMVNLIRDLEGLEVGGITPYAGAGIGLAIIDGEINTPATIIDLDDEAFAYQFIVGGSMAIRSNIDAFAEYRYFATTTIDVVDAPSGAVIDDHDPSYDSVFFGLRLYR